MTSSVRNSGGNNGESLEVKLMPVAKKKEPPEKAESAVRSRLCTGKPYAMHGRAISPSASNHL